MAKAKTYRFNYLFSLSDGVNTAYFSDLGIPFSYGGNTYEPAYGVLSVGGISNDISATSADMTLLFSDAVLPGYFAGQNPNLNVGNQLPMLIAEDFAGMFLTMDRIVFDNNGNVSKYLQRYKGYVDNVSVDSSYEKNATIWTVSFSITSEYNILDKRVSGMYTESSSRRRYYPDDNSFDNVVPIMNAVWDFGKKWNGYSGSGFAGPPRAYAQQGVSSR